MGFRSTVLRAPVLWLVLWGLSSCSAPGAAPPSREEVAALLQREAESLKSDGEDVDPTLGVKIIWEIEDVEIREQPGDEVEPWAGTIRFEITSLTPEYDGTTTKETFIKEFDYVFDLETKRWLMR